MILLKFTGVVKIPLLRVSRHLDTFGLNSVDSIFLSSATLAEYELEC